MSPGPRFLDRIRQFNKRTLNPRILQSAGAERRPFAVVEHVGRRSGATYRTPVIVRPMPEGFIFALTYGPGVDWYRNILASGSCWLGWRGMRFGLAEPESLPAEEALRAFPIPLSWILKLLRKRDFFWMRIATRNSACAQ